MDMSLSKLQELVKLLMCCSPWGHNWVTELNWWYTESFRLVCVLGVYFEACSTEKLKEIPIRSSKLRDVPSQVIVFELAPINSLIRIKSVPVGIKNCREPAQEFPPMTRSCRRAPMGKASQGSRGPPRICLSVYPKTRICLFYYFTTFSNSSDINGGLSPITFLWRKST